MLPQRSRCSGDSRCPSSLGLTLAILLAAQTLAPEAAFAQSTPLSSCGSTGPASRQGLTCTVGGSEVCFVDQNTGEIHCDFDNVCAGGHVEAYAMSYQSPTNLVVYGTCIPAGGGADDFCCQQDLAPYQNDPVRFTLYGTEQGDNIGLVGKEGRDVYPLVSDGRDGDDRIFGGSEGDTLRGGNDNDVIYGQRGDDKIRGGSGNDTIRSGADDDTDVEGGIGHDIIYGGAGSDILNGEEGNDDLIGGAGNDTLFAGSNDASGSFNRLHGGPGDDQLWGGPGTDILYGSLGVDLLEGVVDPSETTPTIFCETGMYTETQPLNASQVQHFLGSDDDTGAVTDVLDFAYSNVGSVVDDGIISDGTIDLVFADSTPGSTNFDPVKQLVPAASVVPRTFPQSNCQQLADDYGEY